MNYHVDPGLGIDALFHDGVRVQSCGRISGPSLMNNYLVPGVDLDAFLNHSVEISLPYMVRNLNHNYNNKRKFKSAVFSVQDMTKSF